LPNFNCRNSNKKICCMRTFRLFVVIKLVKIILRLQEMAQISDEIYWIYWHFHCILVFFIDILSREWFISDMVMNISDGKWISTTEIMTETIKRIILKIIKIRFSKKSVFVRIKKLQNHQSDALFLDFWLIHYFREFISRTKIGQMNQKF
jgi:hypothetical protein